MSQAKISLLMMDFHFNLTCFESILSEPPPPWSFAALMWRPYIDGVNIMGFNLIQFLIMTKMTDTQIAHSQSILLDLIRYFLAAIVVIGHGFG